MRARPTFAFLPPRPPLAAVRAAAFLSAAFLAAAAVVSTAAALCGGLPPRPGAKAVRLARFQAGGSTHYGIVEGELAWRDEKTQGKEPHSSPGLS